MVIMASTRKVAVVTGSNKGIGLAIVKGLCEKYDGDVYLTSRDPGRGQAAVESLKKLNLNPLFHQLDITDQESVNTFRDYLKSKHGGIDILINNAAIGYFDKAAPTVPFAEQARESVRVNYFATLRVCEALFPLLRQNGRVVNVSSSLGHLLIITKEDLRDKLNSPTLDLVTLNQLMERYVKLAEEGKHQEEGWGTLAYGASKIGLTALTFIQQRAFDAETPNRNIAVNAVHPGYVDTDMSAHQGPLTVEQGAVGPLFVALEADYKGKFVWRDGSPVAWDQPLPEAF